MSDVAKLIGKVLTHANRILCQVCTGGEFRCGVGACKEAWAIIDAIDKFVDAQGKP